MFERVNYNVNLRSYNALRPIGFVAAPHFPKMFWMAGFGFCGLLSCHKSSGRAMGITEAAERVLSMLPKNWRRAFWTKILEKIGEEC